MPRSRNIKYSFFTNDELAENDALGRLLFIGLWTLSDCNGNIEWRPKRIKAELLPYDNCDVEALAINLDKSGFIRFYSVQGKEFVNIVNFLKHQNPHKNERVKGSEIPVYSEEARQVLDLKGLAINPDKIESDPDSNGTARADSCSLNPDSCSLNPDTHKSEDQKTSSDKPDGAINRFDDFWQMYPRKTDKKKAQAAWSRLKPTDDLAIKIITNVSNRLASGEWVKGSQYIPHPTTYLNGSRWDDEAQAPDDNRTSREKRNEAIAADSKAKFDAGDLYDPFERIMSGNNDPSIINNDDLLEHQP